MTDDQKETKQYDASKILGYVRDVLALLVIPLLLWGMRLEIGNSQRDFRLEQQANEIRRLEDRLKDTGLVYDRITALTLKQALLEGKLDTANGRLDEIKDLLRRR